MAALVSVTLTVRDHVFTMTEHAAVHSSHFTVNILQPVTPSDYSACEKRSDRDALAEWRNQMIYLHL